MLLRCNDFKIRILFTIAISDMVLLWVSTLRFSYFKTKYMVRPALKNIYLRLRFYTFNSRGIKLETHFEFDGTIVLTGCYYIKSHI